MCLGFALESSSAILVSDFFFTARTATHRPGLSETKKDDFSYCVESRLQLFSSGSFYIPHFLIMSLRPSRRTYQHFDVAAASLCVQMPGRHPIKFVFGDIKTS